MYWSRRSQQPAERRSAFRLHARTAGTAAFLCAFVTALFVLLGTWPIAVAFGVITLVSVAICGWALSRERRIEQR